MTRLLDWLLSLEAGAIVIAGSIVMISYVVAKITGEDISGANVLWWEE